MGSVLSTALYVFFILAGSWAVLATCKTCVVRAVARRGVPGADGPLLYRGDYELVVWGIFALTLGTARLVPAVSDPAMGIAVFFGYAWVSLYGVPRLQIGRVGKLFVLAMPAMPALFALVVGVGNFLDGDPMTGLISLALGVSALIILGIGSGLGQRVTRWVAH